LFIILYLESFVKHFLRLFLQNSKKFPLLFFHREKRLTALLSRLPFACFSPRKNRLEKVCRCTFNAHLPPQFLRIYFSLIQLCQAPFGGFTVSSKQVFARLVHRFNHQVEGYFSAPEQKFCNFRRI